MRIILLINLLLLTSCGLPVYEYLDPPTKRVSSIGNSVSFITSTSSLTKGYILYYKIYDQGDNSTIDSDKDDLDPSNYENDDQKLPLGESKPKSLGFTRIGFINETVNINNPTLNLSGAGQSLTISFENSSQADSDPKIYLNDSLTNSYGVLARGVKYNAINMPLYGDDDTFKRFVKNYEYENDANQYDSDLQYWYQFLESSKTIEIAFVAISFGLSSNASPIYSTPLYLGTITQTSIEDNNLNKPIK